jgi:beta-lactamase class A
MVDRYRNYHSQRRVPQRKKPSGNRLFFGLVVIALFIGGRMAYNTLQKPATKSQAKAVTGTATKKTTPVKAEAINDATWSKLQSQMADIIAANPDLDISVSIVDINSGTKASYGVGEAFHGASTTKVLTAAAYLHDVEQGKRSLDENLGGGSAESHLKRMINLSDNNSWAVLNSAVGYARLDSYAQSIGVSSCKYLGNLMTSSDQAEILSKLYQGKLLNKAHTDLLLSFMQNTNNEDMIPKVNPGGTLYHKYGQLEDRLHDSAIINYKNRPIVLVIYTKGLGDGNIYSSRIQLIQTIATTAFTTIYK